MRNPVLTILVALVFFVSGSPTQAGEPTLEQVTSNPSVGFNLHEDFRFNLSALAGMMKYNNVEGSALGVGSVELRASAEWYFYKQKYNNFTLGAEVRGNGHSDTDGGHGGGFRLDNGSGSSDSPYEQQGFEAYGVFGLHSPSDIKLYGTGIQAAYNLRFGIGAIQRHLVDEQTLFAGFIQLDASLRPSNSHVGGFISGYLNWALEEGGHVARMDWRLDVGPVLVTRTMFRRVRLFGSVGRFNYGAIYEERSSVTTTDMEVILLTDLYIGGGVSTSVAGFNLSLFGGAMNRTKMTFDLVGGGTKTIKTGGFFVGLGVERPF